MASADENAAIEPQPSTMDVNEERTGDSTSSGSSGPVAARKKERIRQGLETAATRVLSEADNNAGIEIQRAKLSALHAEPCAADLEKIDYLKDVDLEASVELGNTVMTVEKILALNVGSIVELNQAVGEEVRLLINGIPYAFGEVVVIGEKFGIRITRIVRSGE